MRLSLTEYPKGKGVCDSICSVTYLRFELAEWRGVFLDWASQLLGVRHGQSWAKDRASIIRVSAFAQPSINACPDLLQRGTPTVVNRKFLFRRRFQALGVPTPNTSSAACGAYTLNLMTLLDTNLDA